MVSRPSNAAGNHRRAAMVLIAVTAAILISAAVPIETKMSPAWRIQVAATGPSPQPLPKCRVTQIWQHYTFQSEGQEDRKLTDSEGWVEFPERSVKATLFERITGAIRNLNDGVHASFGPDVGLLVSCRGYETELVKYRGEGAPTGVILLRKR